MKIATSEKGRISMVFSHVAEIYEEDKYIYNIQCVIFRMNHKNYVLFSCVDVVNSVRRYISYLNGFFFS